MRSALFLDRDGIINIEKNFVYKKEDIEFVDGIFDLVLSANRAGCAVIVVTNQAGIGRGYYTENDFHILMRWIDGEFAKKSARIDRVYFCPDHPEFGIGEYKKHSDDRKPGPGMFFKAARELNINLSHSIMVGDRLSDMQAAQVAGVPTRFCLGECEHAGLGIKIHSLNEVTEFIRKMFFAHKM